MEKIPVKYILTEKFILSEADDETRITATFRAPENFRAYWVENRGKVDETFWEDYFKLVFNNDEKLIDALGEIESTFVTEVFNLGFDPKFNPFIEYINKIWKILGESLPTQEIYNTIHNAAANRNLNKLDVAGTGSLKEKNIIFNPKYLRLKNYEQLKYYLNAQYNLMQKEGLTLNDKVKKALKEFNINNKNKLTPDVIAQIFDSMPTRASLDDLLVELGIELSSKKNLAWVDENVTRFIHSIIDSDYDETNKATIITYFFANIIASGIADKEMRELVFNNAIRATKTEKDKLNNFAWPKDYATNKDIIGTPSNIAWKMFNQINSNYPINSDNWPTILKIAIKAFKDYYKTKAKDSKEAKA